VVAASLKKSLEFERNADGSITMTVKAKAHEGTALNNNLDDLKRRLESKKVLSHMRIEESDAPKE